jgi:hypothetical protein
MTTPTPQCWRPVPSACVGSIVDWSSRSCRLGTKCCTSHHENYPSRATVDGQNIHRLNFAVQELADALAAAGGDLIDRKGWVRESDIARAALDEARGRVEEAKPGDGLPCPNCKTVLVRFEEAFRCLNCGHDVPAPQ